MAQVDAQQSRPLPKSEYYLVFEDFYSGEYDAVERTMRSFSRGAYNNGGARFLDSVCYWTILGESYYRLGEYRLALEQYEAALGLYLNLQAWTTRTQFPNEIQEDQGAARRAQVPWASSKRGARYGHLNTNMLVAFGQTQEQNRQALERGGVIDQLRWRSVDITESMRCVALALYRRSVIKGPTCEIDPFTRRLTSELTGAGGASITGAFTGVARGLAYASLNDYSRARKLLTGSLKIAGMDHPLTPMALLTLGKIAAATDRPKEAEELFMEASICAAAYNQYDVIEDALRYAALLHSSKRTMQPYQPLLDAIGWARKENKDTLQAALLITAAHVAADAGNPEQAEQALQQARREMSRNDLRKTSLQTQFLYVSALIKYLVQDVRSGDAQFQEFMQAASKTSLWLFQIALADNAVVEGVATSRQAELLYEALLREPTEYDWKYRPSETIAYLKTPHYEPMERWFEITLARKAEEKAIGIAEMIRRHRFYSTLPLGGRLLSLRWILEAPGTVLSEKARQQKETLLIRYKNYKDLSDQANVLREQLDALPSDPDLESEDRFKLEKTLEQLALVVDQQEKFIRALALLREPSELSFPAPMSVADVQQRLQPGQAIITFLKVGQKYYVMKLSGGRYTLESQIQARVFDRLVLDLMSQLSVGNKASVYDVDEFREEGWRETARKLSSLIFAKTEPQALDDMKELIIVPDGKAWYLPMEILQAGPADDSVNLLQRVRIRYAPMIALAVPDRRRPDRFRKSAVVAERNFIRDETQQIENGVADLQTAIPEMEVVRMPLAGPSSLLASSIDQLVVWHLSSEKSNSPYDFAPLQMDHGTPGSGLDDWISLPWRGIDQIVLPGVSSAIEGSSRGRADGSELFIAATALMASGSRTVLISRWRVGGQSTLDLTREFVSQLDELPASKAWQRAVELLQDSELNLAAESRLRDTVLEEPMSADHPFFWSGYMLLDTGYDPGESTTGRESTPESEKPDSGQ